MPLALSDFWPISAPACFISPLAHTIDAAGPDVSRAAGDYGTRLIATAGVLNLLYCVLEAFQIGLHQDRKS